MTPLLRLDNLHCRLGQRTILDGVAFDVHEGEINTLLGPSGCGKTTLLHAIAGFVPLANGRIELQGHTIAAPGDALPPERRGIGLVFQDYALFPHLSVRDNIGFGLKSLPKAERRDRVDEALELVQMAPLADRYPHQLSGGQQQRVALARALAPKPRLLLMDEPFSNLDTELRRTLAKEVRTILQHARMTAIVVTHDRDEAFAISDRIGVLEAGRLAQWDRPEAVYHHPATPSVARFVGDGAFIRGRVGQQVIETELGTIPKPDGAWTEGTSLDVFVRPDDIVESAGGVAADVTYRTFMGTLTRYGFRLPNGTEIEAVFRDLHRYSIGDRVTLAVRSERPVAFVAQDDYASADWQGVTTDAGEHALVHAAAR